MHKVLPQVQEELDGRGCGFEGSRRPAIHSKRIELISRKQSSAKEHVLIPFFGALLPDCNEL
jgi:hypothetical protein